MQVLPRIGRAHYVLLQVAMSRESFLIYTVLPDSIGEVHNHLLAKVCQHQLLSLHTEVIQFGYNQWPILASCRGGRLLLDAYERSFSKKGTDDKHSDGACPGYAIILVLAAS